MGKRKKKVKTVTEEEVETTTYNTVSIKFEGNEVVIPESPTQPDTPDGNIELEEKTPVEPTQTAAETEEPPKTEVKEKIVYRKDPCYAVLKDSLKQSLDNAPSFDKVKDNPWLYLEVINQLRKLVE